MSVDTAIKVATKWITSGPQFWITKLLQRENRAVSFKYLWAAVERDNMKDVIPSKRFLKVKVIKKMSNLGNIQRAPAADIQSKATKNGWLLRPDNAFKYIHPDLRAADIQPQEDANS